ncbi:MAG TPA: hypothetical protein PJ987_11850 [Bacteroidia bacterium]|mgnify:CR=1 FL=1|nr:hypothetical protein [Bacteroidia bacterium]HMY42144.1 hypothetical protein [Chitinophagales bacterium]
MNSKNIRFISMSIFPIRINDQGKKIIHHSSILNYGLVNGNRKYITFETKTGATTKTVQEVESQPGHFSVFSLQDIDLDNLIENKTGKPVEVDQNIETGVLLENRFSPVSFLKQELENKILIKPVF